MIMLENGKYLITRTDKGEAKALRYGAPWRDLTGDKLFGALCDRFEALREKLNEIQELIANYNSDPAPISDGGSSPESCIRRIEEILTGED
jgi:hypothetical protein